jgi:sialate O-acetylesterase
MKTRLLLPLVCVAFSLSAGAAVRLPAIFSDHLVLQRDTKTPVWGWADPGEEVTVGIAGAQQTAKAGADGKWMVRFENLKAGGPHVLAVKAGNQIEVKDVLIGEVWLGSGQSNMAMTVSRAKDFDAEKAAAVAPEIRVFTVSSGAAPAPQDDCKGKWVVCAPDTVGSFSATAFFFGREIHRELRVPVGLINSSVGGTPIESWIDSGAQHASPELKGFFAEQSQTEAAINLDALKAKYQKDLAAWPEKAKQAKAEGRTPPRKPEDPAALRARKGNVGGLFNGKIAPLIPFAIRGALWYQGEANSNGFKAKYYQHQLPLLVSDWRARWGYEFPFAWVQLPNFTKPDVGWCVVRDAELASLKLPKTGMAVTIDVGNPKNIHPENKQAVGRRLALWALGTVYGKDVVTSGPLPAGHEIRGGEIVLKFAHTEGGLQSKGGALTGFAVAGEDRQWKEAAARIDGSSVILSSPEVPRPVAARYAWQDNPVCNLQNGAGLPASPFRTDDWVPQPNPAEALQAVPRKPKAPRLKATGSVAP